MNSNCLKFDCCKSRVWRNKFLNSKETVVQRRWESETWKFGFIKRVDKGRITTVKDLESWRFERLPFVRANRGIVGCCWFYEDMEELCYRWKIWWHEFVNKLMEWEAFIDSVWIKCTDLVEKRIFVQDFCGFLCFRGVRIGRKLLFCCGSD